MSYAPHPVRVHAVVGSRRFFRQPDMFGPLGGAPPTGATATTGDPVATDSSGEGGDPAVEGTTPDERDVPAGPGAAIEQLLYIDNQVRVICAVRPGPTLLRVVGEIDRSNSAEVLHTLERARGIDDDLIVDVGRVAFVDVTGIRALVAFAEKGGACVRNAPQQMRRLMRLMQVVPFDGEGAA